MAKNWWSALGAEKHLTEEILLQHIDGALSRKEDDAAARHLRDCWECRTLLERLDSAIHAFMEERRDQFRTLEGTPHSSNGFSARLARHAALLKPESPQSGFRIFFLARRVFWPLAAAAAALAGVGAWPPVRDYVFRSTVPEARQPAPRPSAVRTPPPTAAPAPAPPEAAPLAAVTVPRIPKTQPPLLFVPPTSAELDAAEFAAYLALHEAGLCRGNTIEVLRVPGDSIRITGVADRLQQAENLRAALAGVKLADVRVAIPSEDLSPVAADAAPTLLIEPRPPLLADRLKEHFRRLSPPERAGKDMADYSSQTVRLAGIAHQEAQALRTLATVFTAHRIEAMKPEDRVRFLRLVEEHLQELRHGLTQLGQLLDQLDYDASTAAMEPAPVMGHWEQSGVLLERQTARMDYLIGGLFAGLDLGGVDAGIAWRELRELHQQSLELYRTMDVIARAGWDPDRLKDFGLTGR
ncbi:MAG TPA: hypothetical protein VFQ79_12730 [Bryobacteraceae bacterium]|nr:hypothetical protein [Bryobacteraceae bacterium]